MIRWQSARVIMAASVMGLVLAACGGLSERSFETDSGTWVLYTQPQLPMSGRHAEVAGSVEMDRATGCVYLHQPEFDISYPSVWPADTVVTDAGLRLSDGRDVPEGEWIYGGGGYYSVNEAEDGQDSEQAAILERCPGENNQYGEVAEFDSPADEIRIGK